MDFLDPKKTLRHTIILLTGYVLIGVAIIIATIILLYEAYGFGLGKNGSVIQNGLLFFSSQPHPAQIYIDGKLNKSRTNSSIVMPAGTYNVKLSRTGYRSWQRTIALNGGSVEHFDYPLLFPTKLITTKLAENYTTAPSLATQSPDQRWLLVQEAAATATFDLYDLKNPTIAPTDVTLPASVLTTATSSQSWQVVSWADDNVHVLLQHIYDGKTEYVLLDKNDPSQSVNLSQTLASDTFTQLQLDNKKYDQYYLYNAADQSLDTASLKSPTAVPVVPHVLAFATYSDNTVLYATGDDAAAGKVEIKEQVGSQTYTIRSLAISPTYLLDLTNYNNVPYVAAGSSTENKVYIYDNPVGQLIAKPNHVAVPVQVLQLPGPSYLSFSTNAQFIVAEGGQRFGVYDIQNDHGYNYTATAALDSPQSHATWMDGDRLTYVSGGKLIVLDYDDTNQQTLMPANPNYVPFFAPNYSSVFTLAPTANSTATSLTQTSLFIPADQ